jgi:hypothetical protein
MESIAVSAERPAAGATDDEILGITPAVTRKPSRGPVKNLGKASSDGGSDTTGIDDLLADLASEGKSGLEETQDPGRDDESGEEPGGANAEALEAAFAANPELRDAWHDAKAFREAFPTPEKAREATALLGDLNRMDALFFSRRPEDHVELARAVAQLDPQSFASLARAMTELANGEAARTQTPGKSQPHANGAAQTNTPAISNTRAPEPTAQQSDFYHSTNAAAVQSVMEAIEAQVDRLLPEGISKSARNRVTGEIYRELDSTLQGNRTLGQQMRDAFRSGALDDAHRRAIVSLVTGRARQALPAVAKRVLNEWTNTVVSANQERRAKQRAAEKRVDISGSGGTNGGRRAASSRDIDYGRMSDADILNM